MADTQHSMDAMAELNDLRMSEEARPLYEHVKRFIKETVEPMYEEFERLGEGKTDIWSYAPGQLEASKGPRTRQRKKVSGTSSCRMPKPAKA
jgi:acyl-CoA dehydrogenase